MPGNRQKAPRPAALNQKAGHLTHPQGRLPVKRFRRAEGSEISLTGESEL